MMRDDNPRGPDVFDWKRFSDAVDAFLAAGELTHRAAAERFGGSASCWYRAADGKKLSVGNCLFVARVIGVDPYEFSRFRGRLRADVSRETQTETAAGEITGAAV